jgi:hypothetical protein
VPASVSNLKTGLSSLRALRLISSKMSAILWTSSLASQLTGKVWELRAVMPGGV